MKHVKSLALCLLALALVLALVGCGGGKSDLPGTYKIDLDLAPALNSVMTQLGLAEEDLADLTLPVPYTLTLGEDGTYSMQADKEATVTALHTYLQGCGSAIEAASTRPPRNPDCPARTTTLPSSRAPAPAFRTMSPSRSASSTKSPC